MPARMIRTHTRMSLCVCVRVSEHVVRKIPCSILILCSWFVKCHYAVSNSRCRILWMHFANVARSQHGKQQFWKWLATSETTTATAPIAVCWGGGKGGGQERATETKQGEGGRLAQLAAIVLWCFFCVFFFQILHNGLCKGQRDTVGRQLCTSVCVYADTCVHTHTNT